MAESEERENYARTPRPRGVPKSHPSFGKHVREPVDGPSWPEQKDHGGGRMITRPLEAIWAVGLLAWILYSRLDFICPYFRDTDAARLAFGIGQRLQGMTWHAGVFHQLEKQFGTYVLFEFLARISHINIAGLEHFTALICAILMIGILILNASLAFMIWGRRVALVSTTVLAISPMMWITGEYPTSLVPALFVFMLAIWAMVVSYRVRGGRWYLVLSGILFGLSIVMRADMVLGMLVPICYAYFVDRRGLRRAWILYLITIITLALGYLLMVIIGLDPGRILDVGPHHPAYGSSVLLNWWGMGPFLFVFAFAGFVYRFITDRRPLPFIFFWIVGFNTFYTGHLYSPRYFIPYYPVVSWLAAFAIIALYGWLVRLVKYNKPLRIVFMILFVFGAVSMLTMSIIKEGDGSTDITWGRKIMYARDNGLFPTGSAWFFMLDFHRGQNIQYAWIEDATRAASEELFSPDSFTFNDNRPPIYIGNISQAYLNYRLLADGWTYTTMRGPFLEFQRDSEWSSGTPRTLMMQTVFVGDEVVPELGFLSGTAEVNAHLGSDGVQQIIGWEGQTGAPVLVAQTGWHVIRSFYGLDIIIPGPQGGQFDGSIECIEALNRFFYTDPVAHRHVKLIESFDDAEYNGGTVESHDGNIEGEGEFAYLRNISEISWAAHIRPDRWLALAVNRMGLLPEMQVSVNGVLIEDPEYLLQNAPGYGISRWDILLIPPDMLEMDNEFHISATARGSIFDIYLVQRTYPDCQYRNQVARPLGLEFKDLACER